MGERPTGMTLDRFPDHNGPYEPTNCRWATKGEQSRNHRRNKMLTVNGETLCTADWASRAGISHDTLRYRLKHWSLEKAVSLPAFHTNHHK
jgi:hypothetical protein